jgi:hypothetical protein
VKRALTLALLVAGCQRSPGQHYEIRVFPTPRSLTFASALDVVLERASGDRQHYAFALPRPAPAPPWLLDVQTRDWGSSPLVAQATALGADGALASGVGAPVDGVISIYLQDVVAGTDLALPTNFDFAAAPTDASAAGDALRDQALDGTVVPDLGAADLTGIVLDLAAPDLASALDAGPPDLAGCTTVMLPAAANTELSTNYSSPFGSAPLYIFDVTLSSPTQVAIYRFNLASVPTTANVAALSLRIGYAPEGCGGSCYTCSASDGTGPVYVSLMSSDWDEATANCADRRTGVPWASPCAQGTDVSAIFSTAMHVAQNDTVVAVSAAALAELGTWRSSDLLTLQVYPGVSMAVTSRWSGSTGCAFGTTPQLTVTYCP